MNILALDVSTSIVGVCVVRSDAQPDELGTHILVLDRIEFKKCETLWDKVDAVSRYVNRLCLGSVDVNRSVYFDEDAVSNDCLVGPMFIDRIVIEEPLVAFKPGFSSAQTLSTLLRFNGIVSNVVRQAFKVTPEFMSAAHARKLCGIKVQRTSTGGPQKEQVFGHMMEHDLKHVSWPTTRTGKVVPWSRDACDAYVIARATMIIGDGDTQPPRKPKPSRRSPRKQRSAE